jgi:hypothetical protein
VARWKWRVRCTYNDTVQWPKVPGELAIETVHASDSSKDMEVAVAEARGDVDVEVTRIDMR